ncbi:RNA polymerase sigma-70 factor [Arcticibacter tournemirensis]|uniref:RNA polymerase sigma-70 factor n=1 Tax=Arcticibacter tournemirensis TaxID=699437 RepID=A0A4Q0MA56_9SPHI|nr:RNA polymerase sigma-70 factor [Arcticibacter tournemirensis]RXF70120.1 RNA polymerase sigma-70 factor [Arcticibacter tournemirensis]
MFDSEKNLLVELAAGNESAFKELFNQYHKQLGTYIFRITNSYELAEEIVQDVFLKVWMNHELFANVTCFKAYLFVLSRNHTLNYLRKLTKEQMHKNEWEQHSIRTLKSDNTTDKLYYGLLDKAIDRLPVQQQKVYLLSRHQRLKYAEIASRLDISRETVKKYLQIATASITEYVKAGLQAILVFIFLYIL